MRAIQIDRHGGPEVLQVRDVPEPVAGAGDVLVRTVASSLNPVDWKTRAWDRGPAFPMTLGWDLAGVVAGGADSAFAPGDRVIAMSGQISTGLGTWAELVAIPARLLAPAPATLTLAEAATLPLAGSTARQGLAALGPVAGARMLVTGAAGAVGGLLAQLARSAGAQVDGLVSRPAHVRPAAELGLDRVTHDAAALPRAAYDAVFDTAGVDPRAVLAPGGRYVSISDEPLFPVPRAAKIGVRHDAAGLAELSAAVDRGALRLRVAEYHPIDRVRDAHRRFEAGGLLGKVVLLF